MNSLSIPHTPGPWIYDPDTTHPETGRPLIVSPKDYICEMWDCTGGDGVEIQTPEEQAANAALIAVAPEMLEALKMMLKWNDAMAERFGKRWPLDLSPENAVNAARAAIAKARGIA